MSYFGNNDSGSNPLAFPSYNQLGLQQRSIAGLNSMSGSVSQLQHQFHRQHIPPHIQQGQAPALGQSTPVGAPGANSGHGNAANASVQQANLPPPENQASQPQNGSLKDKNQEDNIDDKLLKRERKNRPGQKFGAKKKSWVWTWFVQDLSDPNVAVCDYCGKIITRMPSDKGLPKKLSEHLKTHKLNKDLINTTRPIPIDGNGISYSLGGFQMPYLGSFNLPSGNQAVVASGNQMLTELPQLQQQLLQHMIQHSMQNSGHGLGSGQQVHQQPHSHDLEDMGPELKSKPSKYRRTNGLQGLPSDRLQIHPQLQAHGQATAAPQGNNQVQYGRRFILPNFDNTPYSASKFHRHLLKFLAENKLSIRLLKLHSFQQLIYDLRPDSIADLLELTGLYSSFVEVSRVDTDPNGLEGNDASMAEANVVNTLAQELIKK